MFYHRKLMIVANYLVKLPWNISFLALTTPLNGCPNTTQFITVGKPGSLEE